MGSEVCIRDRRAHFALLSGAIVWGLIWYPYRLLAQAGIDGVTSSILTYLVALSLGLLAFAWRRAWRGVVPSWWLVAIALAAGGCNIGYVLATLEGEVMRVLLLFYLSPPWTVLLAPPLLAGRLGRHIDHGRDLGDAQRLVEGEQRFAAAARGEQLRDRVEAEQAGDEPGDRLDHLTESAGVDERASAGSTSPARRPGGRGSASGRGRGWRWPWWGR